MVERFFFNRVSTESTRATVADELDFVIESLPYVTKSALSFTQVTVSRTKVALESSIFQLVPVPGFDNRILHSLDTGQIKGQAFGLY